MARSQTRHPQPRSATRGRPAPLPSRLRRGVHRLSGLDLTAVQVHYDSPSPARLGVQAFTRGAHIHLGPGAEEHLPHEAWHVVQQRLGRVQPHARLAGLPVAVDSALEHEADVMGDRALAQGERTSAPRTSDSASTDSRPPQAAAAATAPVQCIGLAAGIGIGVLGAALVGGGYWLYHHLRGRPAAEPRGLADHFGYESEDLSDEEGLSDDDANESTWLRRQSGGRLQRVPVFAPREATHRTARSIRRMRRGTATPRDRSPIATHFGGPPVELTANPLFRDVGAYRLRPREEADTWERDGRARSYGELGRDMDRAARRDPRGVLGVNDGLRRRLMSQPRSPRTAEDDGAMDEAAAVVLTDMARGSRGAELVDEELNDSGSFASRWGTTGSYLPSRKGGSKHIQEETRRRKGGRD